MDLEFHQLDVRYEALRVRRPEQERRVLASLAEHGQQVPIVVVPSVDADRFVVIDGHRRLRALRRLRCDTVLATVWSMSEAEALVLSRSLRRGEAETAIEQGWLLSELHGRFGLNLRALSGRFGHGESWVSARLALVEQLPVFVQERVREGEIGAHAAMKHLVPMARADRDACEALAGAIAPHRLSTRDVGCLYAAWREGAASLRARVVSDPLLFLKARREIEAPPEPVSPTESLLKDLDLIGALARRALRRYSGAAGNVSEEDRSQIARAAAQALRDLGGLKRRLEREEDAKDDHSKPAHGDPGAARQAGRDSPDRPDAPDLPSCGSEGDRQPVNLSAHHRTAGEGGALPQRHLASVRLVQGQPGQGP